MKKNFTTSLESRAEQTPLERLADPYYFSSHREYFNEGDEFLDDAIRTTDQTYQQVDGTLDVFRLRLQRSGENS